MTEAVSAIPGVAPKMPWNSESCSNNGLVTPRAFFTQSVLRFEIGVVPRLLRTAQIDIPGPKCRFFNPRNPSRGFSGPENETMDMSFKWLFFFPIWALLSRPKVGKHWLSATRTGQSVQSKSAFSGQKLQKLITNNFTQPQSLILVKQFAQDCKSWPLKVSNP